MRALLDSSHIDVVRTRISFITVLIARSGWTVITQASDFAPVLTPGESDRVNAVFASPIRLAVMYKYSVIHKTGST